MWQKSADLLETIGREATPLGEWLTDSFHEQL
jgi:hypothetical protein